MKIQEITLGLPAKTATDLNVRVITFDTTATSCSLYYEVLSADGDKLADGNISLSEQEFENWGQDNTYIEDLALGRLGLIRADTVNV